MDDQEQTFDTTDCSVTGMSAEEIDALLDDAPAVSGKLSKQVAADESSPPDTQMRAKPAADVNADLPVEEMPDETEPSSSEAETIGFTLDKVDQDLADLEVMLNEASADDQNEFPSGDMQTTADTASQDDRAARAPAGSVLEDSQTGSDGELNTKAIEATLEEALQEVSQSENKSGSETPDVTAEQPYSPNAEADEADDETATPGTGRSDKRWKRSATRVVRGIGSVVVTALVIMDKPFTRLSMTVKMVLGYIAFTTIVVSIITWIIGSFFRDLTTSSTFP